MELITISKNEDSGNEMLKPTLYAQEFEEILNEKGSKTKEQGLREALSSSNTTVHNYDTTIDQPHWTDVRSTQFLDSFPYQKPITRYHHSDFKIVKAIGEGGQGKIYEVILKESDNIEYIRVLKVFKSKLNSPQGQWPDEILKIASGYLCGLMGYVDQGDGTVGLLMYRYDYDLRTLINKSLKKRLGKPFNDYQSIMFIVRIALGIKALHDHGITHRDLKTSNILLDYDDSKGTYENIVLTDFEDSSDVVGTGFWRAPEVLQALKDKKAESLSMIYTSKSDVYSFAMTCYEILTGEIPLDDHQKSDYDVILLEKKRPKLPFDVDPKLAKLIRQCWHHDPDSRPTALEIVLQLKHLVEENELLSRNLVYFIRDNEEFNLTSNPLLYLDDLQVKLLSLQRFLTPEGFVVSCNYVFEVHKFVYHFGSGVNKENFKEAIITQRTCIECYIKVQEDILAPLWWNNVPRPLTIHVLKLLFKSIDWIDYVLKLYFQRVVAS